MKTWKSLSILALMPLFGLLESCGETPVSSTNDREDYLIRKYRRYLSDSRTEEDGDINFFGVEVTVQHDYGTFSGVDVVAFYCEEKSHYIVFDGTITYLNIGTETYTYHGSGSPILLMGTNGFTIHDAFDKGIIDYGDVMRWVDAHEEWYYELLDNGEITEQ